MFSKILTPLKGIHHRKAYIILLTLAVILLSVLGLSKYFQSLMIQSLSQFNNDFVSQIDTISATSMDIIRNSAMQIYYSSSVKTLRTSQTLTNAQQIIGQRDLGNFVSSSSFINSAMIYNPRMDYVFTSDNDRSSASSENFYDQYAVSLLKNAPNLSFAVSEKQTSKTDSYYSFIFYEPRMPNSGAMILNVNSKWYEQQLLGISSDESCALLDSNGNVLAAGNDILADSAAEIWAEISSQSSNDGFILKGGNSRGWMYCKLTTTNWYYLRYFNMNTLIPALIKMQNFAFMLFSIACVVLVGGGVYTMINFYQPFKAVTKAFIDAGEFDGQSEVAKQVDILLEGQLEQRAQRQLAAIFGGEEKENLRFPITLIMTDSENSAALRELAAYSFEQLTARCDFGSCTLLFSPTDLERIPHFCTKVAQNLNCRCYYSHPCNDIEELSKRRQSLNELWKLRALYFGQYVFSESLLESHSYKGFQPKNTSALFSALHAGQIEEARSAWRDIYSDIKHSRFSDFRFAVKYITQTIDSLYKELNSELLPLYSITIEELEDIQQLQLALDSAFTVICKAESGRRMRRLDRIANQINLRISEGYADDILSAQHIADEMGMNSVYLGRLFRESTGISISEAINRVRVEKAKQLLKETNDSVESIARQVGFNNAKYFFVVFKGIENTTPKKFRTQYLSEQQQS